MTTTSDLVTAMHMSQKLRDRNEVLEGRIERGIRRLRSHNCEHCSVQHIVSVLDGYEDWELGKQLDAMRDDLNAMKQHVRAVALERDELKSANQKLQDHIVELLGRCR